MHLKDFENIIKEVQNPMYRFALSFTKDVDAAKDIVQEGIIRMWKGVEKLSEIENHTAWAIRITRNLCIDHQRKFKANVVDLDGALGIAATSITPDREVMVQDQLSVVQKGLDKLTEQQRTAMVLREVEGHTYQEIADLMNENINQVKILIHRGRLKMKSFIEKENQYGLSA